MTSVEPFKLVSQRLGCLPIVNFLFDRMGLAGQLRTYLPSDDPRLRLAPATVIATVVRNIVADHRPVYALNEWAAPYDPAVLTLSADGAVPIAYHYQPNLERRNHVLKGPQEVAPVYVETAHRIEALLLCHFLAMLTEALLEREIRTSMTAQNLTGIPLYPELRNCPAPSAPRILEIFDEVQRHQLINNADDPIVQTFQPQRTPLQQQVLDLLHIPASVYTATDAL